MNESEGQGDCEGEGMRVRGWIIVRGWARVRGYILKHRLLMLPRRYCPHGFLTAWRTADWLLGEVCVCVCVCICVRVCSAYVDAVSGCFCALRTMDWLFGEVFVHNPPPCLTDLSSQAHPPPHLSHSSSTSPLPSPSSSTSPQPPHSLSHLVRQVLFAVGSGGDTRQVIGSTETTEGVHVCGVYVSVCVCVCVCVCMWVFVWVCMFVICM